MAIAAKISPAELTALVTNRYVGKYYEARLINAPGVSYVPGTTVDATFLANEVTQGTGGYERQVIAYSGPDVSAYSDDGVALATKGTVFAHDGSGTQITFSHAALVEGTGNITALGANSGAPTAGVNGTYTGLPTITGGSGRGCTVNLTIQNSGAASTDYILTIQNAGTGYTAADSIQVQEAVLVAAGAVAASAGDLTTTASTVHTSSEQLLAVAQTASTVNLNGGNETVFYWNLKQFGYYSV
ncbi:hypothetical protein SCRES3_gp88 [Synechococcus phage S-CRES3]|nr:hypothetical protein SCRES3_gp88 [Synechococcus phage S-CRES3]